MHTGNKLNIAVQSALWTLLTAAGVALAQDAGPDINLPLARPTPARITREVIADAYSLRDGETELDVGTREGTGPALGQTLGVRVNRLAIVPVTIPLAVGESYSLRELSVLAYGRDGVLVERAPLRIELEGPEGFIDLAVFGEDGHTLHAAARGIGRLWVVSLLPAVRGQNFSLPVVVIVTADPDAARDN